MQLRLALNSPSSHLSLPSAWIIGMYHQATMHHVSNGDHFYCDFLKNIKGPWLHNLGTHMKQNTTAERKINIHFAEWEEILHKSIYKVCILYQQNQSKLKNNRKSGFCLF